MQYTEYGKTGKKVSAVGFGGMRFDMSKSLEENADLLHYALDKGVNYFDTAPGYCDDKSEEIFGLALPRMQGEFYVSTKAMPVTFDTKDKIKAQVRKSLDRLNVDRIDFFHMWCLRKMEHYELAVKPGGEYEGLLELQQEGLVGHIVCSSHQPGRDVQTIVEDGKVEGVLLGVNILNFPYRWDGVQAARRAGVGVVAMNPLGGGAIPTHEKELAFLGASGESPTEAALRFAIHCPDIDIALPGFTTREHIDQACRIADQAEPFTQDEMDRVRKHIGDNMNEACTGCGYCKDCPQNIPVASYMQFYNEKKVFGKSDEEMKKQLEFQHSWGLLVDAKARAGECIECARCEEDCTQHLPIIERLKEIAEWEEAIKVRTARAARFRGDFKKGREEPTPMTDAPSPEALRRAAERAARVVPHPRQLAWQKLEFIAFFHFTVNTFTDREWGDGTESPEVFNPSDFDALQWVEVCRDAGMKQVVLTAKHHDGFCLWPSAYTEHSVRNSPWLGGRGDVVREVADACRETGLGFGFYLSPWDRHEPSYGTDAYNEHFRNQLREIITTYGPVEEVWFDGACGEGPNGKKQVYDWESYYRLIRDLAPDAAIAICGPDVRWVGNESGFARETEWSVVPAGAHDQDAIAHNFDDFNAQVQDLGSREKIARAPELVWYPAETDVSIRPGWFYHPTEDDKVKTPEELVDIYYKSIGRNTVLLLNLPPDRRGLIHEEDAENLRGMRRILDKTFRRDFALNRPAEASTSEPGHGGANAVDGGEDTWWSAPEFEDPARAPVLELALEAGVFFDRLMLQEHIALGQRVEEWVFEAKTDPEDAWREVVRGTTIGYKRLERFEPLSPCRVRLRILRSRLSPNIQRLGLFKSPKA